MGADAAARADKVASGLNYDEPGSAFDLPGVAALVAGGLLPYGSCSYASAIESDVHADAVAAAGRSSKKSDPFVKYARAVAAAQSLGEQLPPGAEKKSVT